MKTPITIAPEALDFTRLIRSGETVGWAEATAEPVFLTRLLDAQARSSLLGALSLVSLHVPPEVQEDGGVGPEFSGRAP